MDNLAYRLERTVYIGADTQTVFRFFTDSARWSKWWGPGSSIDARIGGKVLIRHPNGVETVGEVLEIVPNERLMFTYGYISGEPIPPGSSTVTIRLERVESGTRLNLLHAFADMNARDEHVQGWRFQLSLFANAVSDETHADAAQILDAWFDAWSVSDDSERQAAFAAIVAPTIQFRDRFSSLDGIVDLSAHAGAAQKFMPGVRIHRKGELRHCQGMIVAEWIATGENGKETMSGINVFVLGPDSHILCSTGFLNRPAAA